MPENIKAIRKRISGVKNTKQLTRAMKMVSAAKLRRAQDRVEGSRPYMAVLEEMIQSVAGDKGTFSPISGKNKACLVFSSDRGLCGSYNANVIKAAKAYYEEFPETRFFLFGKKVNDFFTKNDLPVARNFPDYYTSFSWETTQEILNDVLEYCTENQIGTLSSIYTRFVSAGVQRLTTRQVFPFNIEKKADKENTSNKLTTELLIVEPDRQSVLNALVDHFSSFTFYYIGSEVIASEHGARMAAMDQATRNASEVIDRLTLVMNRARQAAITKELLEIIGGKEALEN